MEKIKILGSGFEKELMEQVRPFDCHRPFSDHFTDLTSSQIPPENLPHALGGHCDCPDGGCSLSDAGPWNTEEGRKVIEEVREEEAKKRSNHKSEAQVPNGK